MLYAYELSDSLCLDGLMYWLLVNCDSVSVETLSPVGPYYFETVGDSYKCGTYVYTLGNLGGTAVTPTPFARTTGQLST